eukprot:146862_1
MSEISTTIDTVMEEYHLPLFELIMAPITILLFVILAIVLFIMIIHLIRGAIHRESNQSLFFFVATILGISSFEISLINTIIVTIQLFLMDDVLKQSSISSTFFFATYHIFQYLIAIFDSLGHLLSLLIFIARFDVAFKQRMLNPWKQALLIRFMYIMLIILTMFSLFIMFYIIPFETNSRTLLTWEIVWELCVESMIIFVIYLFISKLCQLLKLLLSTERIQQSNKTDFATDLFAQTKNAPKPKPKLPSHRISVTIDGIAMEMDTNQTAPASPKTSKRTIELLTLVSRLTVLVIVSAVGSFVTIIGNLVIKTHAIFDEKDITAEQSHAKFDHDAIWVFVLPVMDIVLTSFMLYLQFDFTKRIYHKMCHCLDHLFLQCLVSVMFCCWAEPDEASESFVLECNSNMEKVNTKSSIEVRTTSPTSELHLNYPSHNNLTVPAQSNSQIPIESVMRI